MLRNSYYISSFFWSTFAKVLNAILGFISVPLLLGYFGKADYGLLSIAMACNGYMNLLDLGMNVGAVKYFSHWKAEGRMDLLLKVAHTNITFYVLIAIVNAIGLFALGLFGEGLFAVTHDQFIQLRTCLFTLAFFSIFSWTTTAFNQLLVADKQMAFTMKVQSVQVVLKMLLIFIVVWGGLSLSIYFFFLTFIVALLILPYAMKCLKCNLIENLKPRFYWKEFRVVLIFSLSIFALSLFQVTSTQSRPLLLSIFATNGAEAVADFRIIEVIPMFVIMIGGTFSGVFLPKSSELVAKKDQKKIEDFAYKWTRMTTILANILCFPFILCAEDVLTAYVGSEYKHLYIWLIIWLVSTLLQIHTTPANSLIYAYGKTRMLVIATAVSCVLSLFINISLCKYLDVGSAVIAYFAYIIILLIFNYVVFYRKLMSLNRKAMVTAFLYPTMIGATVLLVVSFVSIRADWFDCFNLRIAYIIVCVLKALLWLIPYIGLLIIFKLLNIRELIK